MSTPQVAAGRTLRQVLERLGALELDTSQKHRPDLWMRHPRSGYVVRNERARTIARARGLLPGLVDLVPGPLGMGEQPVPGSERPPRYLYRAIMRRTGSRPAARVSCAPMAA